MSKYKIKELRKEKGITQQQLSEMAKVSRTLISMLEAGEECVTTTGTLQKIANTLECKVTDLFFE